MAQLLQGRSEAGGSVLEARTSPERIAEPGVDEGTTSTSRLVEGRPSTAGTNTGVGQVAPPSPTLVLVVAASILEGSPTPVRLSGSCRALFLFSWLETPMNFLGRFLVL